MEQTKTINQLAAKNGLIIGIVTVVFSLALHFVDPLLQFTNSWVGFISFAIFIGLLIYAGKAIRTEIGGYWKFSDAFKAFLVISLIVATISVVFNVLMVTVIDPDLPATAGAAMDENNRAMMAKFGMTEEQIDQAQAQSGPMEEHLKPTGKNLLISFGTILAIYGVISLIMAAILKKNPPIKLQEVE
jgi:hypothetical protein